MIRSIQLPACCSEVTLLLSRIPEKMRQGSEQVRISFQNVGAASRTAAQTIHRNTRQFTIQTREYAITAGTQIRVHYTQISTNLMTFSQAVIAQPRVFAENMKNGLYSIGNQIKDFVLSYKSELFFVACTITTAVISPGLFFSSLVVTVILRVVADDFMKGKAKEWLRDEKNPYLTNPTYGSHFGSPLRLTMGIISAISAISLTALSSEETSFAIRILPLLGGIAAGNVIAEGALDIVHHINVRLNRDSQTQQ